MPNPIEGAWNAPFGAASEGLEVSYLSGQGARASHLHAAAAASFLHPLFEQ
jgi:hypothetical protein